MHLKRKQTIIFIIVAIALLAGSGFYLWQQNQQGAEARRELQDAAIYNINELIATGNTEGALQIAEDNLASAQNSEEKFEWNLYKARACKANLDYVCAYAAYEAAHNLKQTPETLLGMAEIAELNQEYVKALEKYRDLLTEIKNNPDVFEGGAETSIEAKISELEKKI
ncbi:MAG: hypothetical protein WDZ81_01380 [Candidatus Saccharimonadales bacterium]